MKETPVLLRLQCLVGEEGHAQVESISVNRAVVRMTEVLFKSIIKGVTPGAGVELGAFL